MCVGVISFVCIDILVFVVEDVKGGVVKYGLCFFE